MRFRLSTLRPSNLGLFWSASQTTAREKEKRGKKEATLRMIDVLVTQHSKWTARAVRRALFGQSIVDFTANPWIGIHSERNFQEERAQEKTKEKQSRLEREFSQGESLSSGANT